MEGKNKMEKRLRKQLRKIAELSLPDSLHLFIRYQYRKWTGLLDQEMLHAEKLLKNHRRFLDIGSNIGIYSYHFLSLMRNIDSFDPLEEITYRLNSLNKKSLNVHNIALSDQVGTLSFYLPIRDGSPVASLASLEPRDGKVEELLVEVKRLDDFMFRDVDLIKIDVEGHEVNVIRGSRKTLEINKPILIVEIEQRHINQPISNVFNEITTLGYQGFFLEAGFVKALEDFDYNKHQKPYLSNPASKNYINNFIFSPVS